MSEDYVSFEIAKLLKEKGFDEYCHKIYEEDGILFGNGDYLKNSDSDIKLIGDEDDDSHVFVTAPTHQTVMKWLRETHNICIAISCDVCDSFEFYATIYIKGEDSWITCVDYEADGSDDYKQVTESAIKYCLGHLI